MEIGEFVQSIKRKLGMGPKVYDLIPPPQQVGVKESPKIRMSEQQTVTGVKPGMNEIKKLPELKVNPTEFNKRNKN